MHKFVLQEHQNLPKIISVEIVYIAEFLGAVKKPFAASKK